MARFLKQRDQASKIVDTVGTKASDLQSYSLKHLKRYFTRRTDHLSSVKRFVASWLVLVTLLIIGTTVAAVQVHRSSRVSAAAPGGTYTEGMVGTVNNLNPLFGSGEVDDSLSALMFNGLLRYDTRGALVPDLAKDIQVDDSNKIYTLNLQRGVLWHDGEPFTSKDVVYTITAIQDPATRSALYSSWQGIKVSAVNDYKVTFELPAPFAPFPSALVLPILPEHLLRDVARNRLRTANFNNQPVGTGPFVFSVLRSGVGKEQQAELKANDLYFRKKPKLDRFVIHTFEDDAKLVAALKDREITAAVDLKTDSNQKFVKDTTIRSAQIPLNSGVFTFFKTTAPNLTDANVRTALAEAVDRQPILESFNYQYAALKTPLLPSQIGYDATYAQQTNIAGAEQKLDAAGWVKQPNGTRTKDGNKLELTLVTANTAQYVTVASELQKQWAKVGVTVKPQLLSSDQLQQSALTAHAYDMLLIGTSIGADPDVFAYWDSSQVNGGTRRNFSEWTNGRADTSLETARTRLDPVLRTARYKTFLDEWRKQSPAVALYQPRASYLYHENAAGFTVFPVTNTAERLTNVEEWTVNTRRVQRTP